MKPHVAATGGAARSVGESSAPPLRYPPDWHTSGVGFAASNTGERPLSTQQARLPLFGGRAAVRGALFLPLRYLVGMPSRRPTKAEQRRIIAIDLLADWNPYADPLLAPASEHDWRYFGVVTIDGVPGALAWRAGDYGVGVGSEVRALGLWDRIKINALLDARPPGIEHAPRFEPSQMANSATYMGPPGV